MHADLAAGVSRLHAESRFMREDIAANHSRAGYLFLPQYPLKYDAAVVRGRTAARYVVDLILQ